MLFVGRNDGFDARNNDNFFKILWSNLINFDKKRRNISDFCHGCKKQGEKEATMCENEQ